MLYNLVFKFKNLPTIIPYIRKRRRKNDVLSSHKLRFRYLNINNIYKMIVQFNYLSLIQPILVFYC